MNKFLIKITKYYELGLYTDENLETFVKAGFISKEEKEFIIKNTEVIKNESDSFTAKITSPKEDVKEEK